MKEPLYVLLAKAITKVNLLYKKSNQTIVKREKNLSIQRKIMAYIIVLKDRYIYDQKTEMGLPIVNFDLSDKMNIVFYNTEYHYNVIITPHFTLLKQINVKVKISEKTSSLITEKRIKEIEKFYYKRLTEKVNISKFVKENKNRM